MKIAVLASGQGEKALYLHDFFKEGNRVEIDCVVTDREDAGLARSLGAEGIATYVFPEADWQTGDSILRLLQEREEEIVVVDDLDRPVPPLIKEFYGDALLVLQGTTTAPGEVVNLYNSLKAKKEESKKYGEKPQGDLTQEEDWARALKVDYDEEEARRAVEAAESREPERAPEEAVIMEERPRQSPPPVDDRRMPQEPMPDTYLVWSVLATIFCCLIPGIVAIVMSSAVSSRYFNGDIEGARRASRNAQIWVIISVVSGIIWLSLYVPLMFLTS